MAERFVYDPGRDDFQDRIYDVYTTLRDRHPVYRDEAHGFYALSRFDDVRAAANDPVTFSSEGHSMAVGLLPHIQMMDPPRHDRLRNLVNSVFTPRRVAAMERRVRAIARELLDAFASDGRCDLRSKYALQLPSRVIGEMIGVPPDRRERFVLWTEAMVASTEEQTRSEGAGGPAAKIYEEFAQILEERRRARRDDLVSALLDGEIDGERLTQEELLGFCFVLIVAGNDTTTNLIANGAALLAKNGDQRRLLLDDPARIPGAVEEILRLESPAQALPRLATRDVVLHGTTIPAGAEVKLVFGAANRDEREFDDPDRFDVTRVIKRHLAFGQGIHFCMGSNLARLEGRVALEELLARLPCYELEGEPGWVTSIWARAHTNVPIRFDPA